MKIPNKKKLKKPTTQKSKKLSKTPTQKFTRPSSFCYTLLDGRYPPTPRLFRGGGEKSGVDDV